MEQLPFLTEQQVRDIQREYGTPVFVYDRRTLETQARNVLDFPHAFGLTARYAMKALPNAAVIRVFNAMGLHIDASSGFEARRAMRAGVPANQIQVTAQEIPADLDQLLDEGVLFTCCSLHQLETYGRIRPGSDVCVRVNPGLGSGHNNRTNVGGPSASFGIWHEHLDQVFDLLDRHNLRLTRMHTHIGSGADPAVWDRCVGLFLGIAARLPDVDTLSLGGGFKVGRMADEVSTDLRVVGDNVAEAFRAFRDAHGRELKLEIEPGTYLVANAGAVITTVTDVVDTGPQGYTFIKVDSGMTEVVRPSMYGAQHPLTVVPAGDTSRGTAEYLVAGHCCESGDILTPAPGNPEGLLPRTLTEARIGDALVVGGSGAYCAAMSSKNYNSFPEAPEVLLETDGAPRLIRKRQTLDQILANEVDA
ncbi:MAG: diaminopimelate decarboxylase [Nitrospiraceae bacterium]|nr:diaminopimelate decarboxylase [Nitrospiraceae bacterium]